MTTALRVDRFVVSMGRVERSGLHSLSIATLAHTVKNPMRKSIRIRKRSGLHAIVLAAGASRRYGSPKQLASYRGETLLARSVRLAHEAGAGTVFVVLGYRAQAMRRALQQGRVPPSGTTIVRNARWRDGMGRSLACGARSLDRRARAVLVCLADQPLLEAADLVALVRAWRASPRSVVASRYAGKPGVPAIFPRSHFDALKSLSGDRGARMLLASSNDVLSVPVPLAAVDIDDPRELRNLPS